MIRYSLKCAAGHGFESWFQNAAAFSALLTAGQVSCPVCGSDAIEKDLMAPAVRPARNAAQAVPSDRPDLSAPASEIEEKIAALRRQF